MEAQGQGSDRSLWRPHEVGWSPRSNLSCPRCGSSCWSEASERFRRTEAETQTGANFFEAVVINENSAPEEKKFRLQQLLQVITVAVAVNYVVVVVVDVIIIVAVVGVEVVGVVVKDVRVGVSAVGIGVAALKTELISDDRNFAREVTNCVWTKPWLMKN